MEYGVSIVINDNRGRILIMRRSRKEKSFPGLWDLPGGKVEPLESLQEAAIREVKEESALFTDLDKSYFNIYKCPDRDLNIYGFGANMVRGQVKLSNEHSEYKWVKKHECNNFEYVPSVKANLEQFFKN